MTIEFAKFTAEVAKGIKIGSDVEVKLLIPLKSAVPFLEFLSNSQGQDVMVHLGDPQAAFDFEDREDDPMYNSWTSSRRVTTDASGVVTRIEGTGEPDRDKNQAQLFGPAEAQIDQEQPTGDSQETGDSEGQPTVQPTGADDPGTDPSNPYGDDDDDIPDWMKGIDDDKSGSKEMDFSSDDSNGDQPSANENPPKGDTEVSTGDVDQDELERYILENRPIIPEITLDIPAAIERKRGSDMTWREIAADLGMSQGKLSGMLSRYKKAVKDQMIGNGIA
ncbi:MULTISPECIES: hypothetical protein [unclassified Paenibacillus]|uniref:hypothetical protein n=1 Tax=Paenibacillus TaxID=44249 RepID=UPI000CFC1915|nr:MULTISPECIES: hypothetical protein [unclassified Paenibacillus]PRA04850.1 hypothetical protein CQ043_12405 [Paenibacillus sp. MYb63]PRA47805.1 hypothetical protein CQ061_14425 [Paenibacillus sp. MYb67]